mmetsp:Transcript_6310/g.17765  ORF Transcript_6310/g.17765 Transcript_6310/m.17765 type:complete len:209 (-) Transcript_6310:936-1562(-)
MPKPRLSKPALSKAGSDFFFLPRGGFAVLNWGTDLVGAVAAAGFVGAGLGFAPGFGFAADFAGLAARGDLRGACARGHRAGFSAAGSAAGFSSNAGSARSRGASSESESSPQLPSLASKSDFCAGAAAGAAAGAGAGAGTMSSSENRRGAGHWTGACFALAFNSAAAGDAGSTSSLMGDGGGLFCGLGLSAFRKVQGPSYPLKAASRF